jgi:hypothetical protein
LDEGFCGSNYIVTFGAHAAAAINDEADRDRNIRVTEMFDALKYAVLENLEIIFVETGDGNTFVIFRGGMKDDESNRHFYFCG